MKTATKILQAVLQITPNRDYKEIGLAATPDYLIELEQATEYLCKKLAETYDSLSMDILLPAETREKAKDRATEIGTAIGKYICTTVENGTVADDISAMIFDKETESD